MYSLTRKSEAQSENIVHKHMSVINSACFEEVTFCLTYCVLAADALYI